MKKSLTLASFALLLNGFFASGIHAEACPELTRDEISTLCRWTIISKVTFGKIKSGTITKDGVTLTNTLKTCGQGDSLKAFLKESKSKTYPAELTKDPKDPNNSLKGLCTYNLGKEKIAFNIQLPATAEGSPIPSRKVMAGFNYFDNGKTSVEVKPKS